jgi:hypothetical protein
MARPSRPPGFDMTYRPKEEFFGPPLWARVPSFLHAALAVVVVILVVLVERRPGSALYAYMFRQEHLIDAHMLAAAFGVSGTASLIRGGMRGVRVRPDWVEYRDVIGSLWPRVKKFRWAQIDQIIFEPSGSISVDLWDGRREFLPKVDDRAGLGRTLERVALARAIPLSGATGLDDLGDLDDLNESAEGDA